MPNSQGMLLVIGICAAVLLLISLQKRAEWLLNFILRMVMGSLAILAINASLPGLGIAGGVGLNPVTVLTTGLLGFPGLTALYGIYFYKTL
ncbi:MAG: pro-sigmaK processing inhibitor BofA family protein [Lachnospiraceae bacterium]|nr:pro-sigmaK processing inhibitor BofA family protein [Lachnospiraceae bacterium]